MRMTGQYRFRKHILPQSRCEALNLGIMNPTEHSL